MNDKKALIWGIRDSIDHYISQNEIGKLERSILNYFSKKIILAEQNKFSKIKLKQPGYLENRDLDLNKVSLKTFLFLKEVVFVSGSFESGFNNFGYNINYIKEKSLKEEIKKFI